MKKVTYFDVEYANSKNKSICQIGLMCENYGTKVKRAISYNQGGSCITILKEADFFSNIRRNESSLKNKNRGVSPTVLFCLGIIKQRINKGVYPNGISVFVRPKVDVLF